MFFLPFWLLRRAAAKYMGITRIFYFSIKDTVIPYVYSAAEKTPGITGYNLSYVPVLRSALLSVS